VKPITAQLGLYPLRQPHLGPGIERALEILRRHGLDVEPGRMSTLASGPAGEVFAALEEVFAEASADGDLVMVVTLSNACPDVGGRAVASQPDANK
jgi:uncharacterized protein YqgV (UPF0045/DUF77 family)